MSGEFEDIGRRSRLEKQPGSSLNDTLHPPLRQRGKPCQARRAIGLLLDASNFISNTVLPPAILFSQASTAGPLLATLTPPRGTDTAWLRCAVHGPADRSTYLNLRVCSDFYNFSSYQLYTTGLFLFRTIIALTPVPASPPHPESWVCDVDYQSQIRALHPHPRGFASMSCFPAIHRATFKVPG